MAEVLLVNPRRRRRRKTRARRRRSTSSRRRRRSVARAVPRRRRRRSRARVVHANPRRRRSRRSITRSFRRRRRNPSLRGGLSSVSNSVMPTLKAGFTGALGALGLDLLWGYGKTYLPASIAGSAIAQYAAKLAGAILVGVAANKLPLPFIRGKGRDMAVGAATVVLHDALKAQLQASFPTLQLGEYLTYAPTVGTMRRAGALLDTGMGEYLSGIPNDGSGGTNDDLSYTGEYNGDGMNGYG
jgi:hypothetical protein